MALSNNVIDKSKDNFHHNHHETSSDEGVCTEESECSNSALPSPKLNNHRQTKDLKRNSYNNDNNNLDDDDDKMITLFILYIHIERNLYDQ